MSNFTTALTPQDSQPTWTKRPFDVDGALTNHFGSLGRTEPIVSSGDFFSGGRLSSAVGRTPDGIRSIVFVDDSIDLFAASLRGIQAGTKLVRLSAQRDGLADVTYELARHKNLDSVHFFVHGAAGRMKLGATELSFANLERYKSNVRSWSKSFGRDADLLIYGCNVGKGAIGSEFVSRLSDFSGTDVAASTDFTGNKRQGGNWILESLVGNIETQSLTPAFGFKRLLPIVIRAAGTEGDETMDLRIDGVTVKTWANVGGDADAGVFQSFTFQNSEPLTLDRIRVAFTNDESIPNVFDRNLRVDWIQVDGITTQTEAPTVFSTGTFKPADGAQPGFRESEFLHIDGYFQYGGNPGIVQGVTGVTPLGPTWQSIPVPTSLIAPVVILGSPTNNDDQPGVASLGRNISGDWRVRFREWNYQDGIHGQEAVEWMALLPGRYQSMDGSIWEIGRFTTTGTQAWKDISFSGFFASTPKIFITQQTSANAAPSLARVRNVTRTGFQSALFNDELTAPRTINQEIIGYVAIYSPAATGSVELGSSILNYRYDTAMVNSSLSALPGGYRYRLQEEQSRDSETTHVTESVRMLQLGNLTSGTGGFAQSQSFNESDPFEIRSYRELSSIGGSYNKQSITGSFGRINLTATLDPIVIAGPPRNGQSDPGVVAVRNVSKTGFDIRFKEWNYLDGVHPAESVDWFALQPGRYVTSDGSIWETGTLTVKGNAKWSTRAFSGSFSAAPNLFLTSQNADGTQPAYVRARNVTANGFEAALFEEQATLNTSHGTEIVGYLAIQGAAGSGVVSIGGNALPYLLESKDVDHNLTPFSNNVRIKLEEEQSADAEVLHSRERVNAARLGTLVLAQSVTYTGGDPFALRIEKGLPAVQLPPGFVIEKIGEQDILANAVALELAPDGRQFVAEGNGKIWVFRDGVRQAIPFIDLSGEVQFDLAVEDSLTGFVLDPNFATNRHFYLMYPVTVNGVEFGRIVRYTQSATNPDQADLSSRVVLMGSTAANGLEKGTFHNTGDMEFGTDGSLLISWGDTSSNSETDPRLFLAQDLGRLAGKILRINPANGLGYSSNPFFNGDLNSNRSRVWAYGLRNGFRFEVNNFNGQTDPNLGRPGTLYIGEVGRYLYDELNICRGGENFGWPYFEGPQPYQPGGNGLNVVDPIVAFAHPETRSIIGGAFYGGTAWPTEYRNRFFVADFVEGWIRTYLPNSTHTGVTEGLFATGIKGMTDMEYDPISQSIYLVGMGADFIFFDDQGLEGLYRLRYVG